MPASLQHLDVERLGRDGYFIRHDWLEASVPRPACAAAQAMEGFRACHVGRGQDRQALPHVRGDELQWLTQTDTPGGLVPVVNALERLKHELNETAFLGLDRTELQLSRYREPGAHYRRHRDSFRGQTGRRVTGIYYLNDGWLPIHGGCLRLHVLPTTVDIAPRLNCLVVFLSERVEHEVLDSFAHRWALTVWWSGRAA